MPSVMDGDKPPQVRSWGSMWCQVSVVEGEKCLSQGLVSTCLKLCGSTCVYFFLSLSSIFKNHFCVYFVLFHLSIYLFRFLALLCLYYFLLNLPFFIVLCVSILSCFIYLFIYFIFIFYHFRVSILSCFIHLFICFIRVFVSSVYLEVSGWLCLYLHFVPDLFHPCFSFFFPFTLIRLERK